MLNLSSRLNNSRSQYHAPAVSIKYGASAVSSRAEDWLRVTTHPGHPDYDFGLLRQGPRMVRDVFRLAKENEPAIIFIDEVDAIATARFDAQTGADR